MLRWAKLLLFVFIGVLLLASAGFFLWASNPLPPMPQALEALRSEEQVEVIFEEGWLVFLPRMAASDIGLIFYPGGRVDFRAYAPAAKFIAARGYPVFLMKMPLNLAVFNPDAAEAVMKRYPQIERWVVGGHSLGGAMAAGFAEKHPQRVVGLVLWASYPARNNGLSAAGLAVLAVYADRDSLATLEQIESSRSLLPADTQWVRIQGGNHAQFGWYGDQPGDGVATITREVQQEQTLSATVQFLESLKTR